MLWTILFVALTQATPAPADEARQAAGALATKIVRADYEGDRSALKRLHDELTPFRATRGIESRVRYWQGFALWRRTLNGFNESTNPAELEQDVTLALTELEDAVRIDPAFVDPKVAMASLVGNLMYLNMNNKERVQSLVPRFVALINEARAAAPDNVRLLWVMGASQWYNGKHEEALANYQRGLEVAAQQRGRATDPLEPSWGEPEILMNLAWSHLNKTPADVAAAERYGKAALAQVPYWHYMRDILMPQIQQAKAKPPIASGPDR
jgi:tetratricopeptide (TPR) repeat protein